MCSDGFIESICMNVTNGDGQSIGCIVRLRCLAEFQKRTNHLLNLHLFGTAVTGDGTFHFQRRIFEHRQIRFGRGKHGYAADVPELQSALNIIRIEQAFESSGFGLQVANDFENAVMDGTETSGERFGGFGSDDPAADERTFGAIAIDDAVTGNSASAVYSQNAHTNLAADFTD